MTRIGDHNGLNMILTLFKKIILPYLWRRSNCHTSSCLSFLLDSFLVWRASNSLMPIFKIQSNKLELATRMR